MCFRHHVTIPPADVNSKYIIQYSERWRMKLITIQLVGRKANIFYVFWSAFFMNNRRNLQWKWINRSMASPNRQNILNCNILETNVNFKISSARYFNTHEFVLIFQNIWILLRLEMIWSNSCKFSHALFKTEKAHNKQNGLMGECKTFHHNWILKRNKWQQGK